MLRYWTMSLGFIGSTLVLLWIAMASKELPQQNDQVTRSSPELLDLGQVSENEASTAHAISLIDRSQFRDAGAPHTINATSVETSQDVSMAVGYDVLRELQKATPQPTQQQAALATPQADRQTNTQAIDQPLATQPANPPQYTHLVQQGESLHGIAFRYFGTTVAYRHILEANRHQIASVEELEPGMTLIIPR